MELRSILKQNQQASNWTLGCQSKRSEGWEHPQEKKKSGADIGLGEKDQKLKFVHTLKYGRIFIPDSQTYHISIMSFHSSGALFSLLHEKKSFPSCWPEHFLFNLQNLN